jgi:nucleotidyltransferase substrate binding protein (TIGR01987 family)
MEKAEILNQLSRSYQKLLEALETPVSQPLAIDGTIRRFEFTYEIACETIIAFYEECLNTGKSHNKCLREALKQGWLTDGEVWASLIESKSHAAFAYSEQLTMDVYKTVKKNHHVFDNLITTCREQAPQQN